jgi:hypothetical protein
MGLPYNKCMQKYLLVLFLPILLVACGNQNQGNSINSNGQASLIKQCDQVLQIFVDSEITKDKQWSYDEAGRLDQQLLEKELIFEDAIIRDKIREYNQSDPYSRDANVLITQIAQYCDSKLSSE